MLFGCRALQIPVMCFIAAVPNLLATGTSFVEDNFSTDCGVVGGGGGGFRMIQVHYLYCALYFYYYYYISSTLQLIKP